jgi:ABC-type Mn2+/Zn2+ transport system permease subunit
MSTPEAAELGLAVVAAIASGLLGCFAVMRRMALAADAISHVALPGIGVAIAIGLHPLFGALAMLCFGALLIWGLERRTRIATETIVGVVFSAALAVGSLTSSDEDLVDALFGGAGTLTTLEIVFGFVIAMAIVWFVLARRGRLVLRLLSPEIAKTSGIDVARLDLEFLLAFALTVALGLRYLGVLLMGSMIIIPAATAKRLARKLDSMLAYAVGIAVVVTVLGTEIAVQIGRPSGPVIICCAAALFLASLAVRR